MTLIQLKLKAVILTALMQHMVDAQKGPTPEQLEKIQALGQELDLAETHFPDVMARNIEDDLDALLAAIESIPEEV
jgi:hypothetical protein